MHAKNLVMTAAVATVLSMLGTQAEAQLRPWEISLGGGPSFATGDFGDVAETGFHVQGSLGFGIPLFPVGFRADLLWQELGDNVDGTFRQIGGIANVTLGMPLVIIEPYLVGGVGIFSIEQPEGTHSGHTHSGESTTSTGFNIGAGLEGGLLGLKGFAEVRYLDAGEGHKTIPVTVGIRF